MNYNFCKIYLSSNINSDAIILEIDKVLPSKLIDIYVDENDEFDETKQVDFPDGFLFFRFMVDISFPEGFSPAQCVKNLNQILLMFWDKGFPAVASYDFEQELINYGGFKSKNIPWPK
jgi:hypothetical protein